jgi:hypothetical protein
METPASPDTVDALKAALAAALARVEEVEVKAKAKDADFLSAVAV